MATFIGKGADKKSEARNCLSAQQFMDYFNEKVAAVRPVMGGSPQTTFFSPSQEILEDFMPYSAEEVASMVMAAPMKSCTLDPLPTHILKEFLQKLLPFITNICNA